MQAAPFDAIIVGGGPRAVATVLRVVARTPYRRLRIAIVDAVEVGSGATWRIDQPAEFLNNTTARSTTIHADESTPMLGPVVPGPDLVDWSRRLVALGDDDGWATQEARALEPDSFPSRRLQGVYYRAQLDVAEASGLVELTRVVARVVDCREDGEGSRVVRLADGRELRASLVVLAQGMLQSLPDEGTRHLADAARRHGLVYVAPGMPAERDWSAVPAAEPVIVRGLGANFFDVVARLTLGRGGSFEAVPGDARGRLRYVSSGREPILCAGSRRGVPYRAKPDGWSEPSELAARYASETWFDALADAPTGSVDLRRDAWPTMARELAAAHLVALAGWAPKALRVSLAEGLDRLDGTSRVADVDEVLTTVVDPAADGGMHVFTIDSLRRPTRGERIGPERWARMVEQLVESELDSMSEPARHPRACVNRVMGVLRGRMARVASSGALEGRSAVVDFDGWFNADGLFLASGPPPERARQVLALIDAGVLHLTGPETAVSFDERRGTFVASSAIAGTTVIAKALIEPRMAKGQVPRTDDPLLRALLDSGRARVHVRGARDGTEVPTDSLDVTGPGDGVAAAGLNLVRGDGTIDERIVVLGIPALSTQPGSAIGASPGRPSPLLAGADVAARQILARAGVDPQGASSGAAYA